MSSVEDACGALAPDPGRHPVQGPSLRTVATVAALAAGVLATAALAYAVMQRLPDDVTVRLFGHGLTLHSVHERVLGRIVVVLLILPLALLVELAVVGWAKSSLRSLALARSGSLKSDLAVFGLGQAQVLDLVGRVMLLGLGMVSGLWVRERLRQATGFAVDPGALPFLVQLPLYFLVYTFFDYWTHRIGHLPLFWPLHRYHHSAEDFCTLTSDRQHPAAALVGLFVINIPLALLGAPAAVMVYVNVLTNTFGYLAHSRMTGDWGFVGRWVLQSPRGHRLHHKLSMDEPTGHYGMVPLWDRLFGTWVGTPAPDLPIGVSKPYRHGWLIFADLLRDYADFWRGLLGRPAEL